MCNLNINLKQIICEYIIITCFYNTLIAMILYNGLVGPAQGGTIDSKVRMRLHMFPYTWNIDDLIKLKVKIVK